MNKSYNPSAWLSPASLETVGDGRKRRSTKNLVFTVLKGKLLFILLLIHGGRGVRCEQARGAAWRGTGITSPREGGDAAPVPAPDTASDSWRNRKSSHPPGKQIAFLRPIDFLIFWHFLVASIPFLVFSSMSQKTKMSKQLRAEISISCQSAVFPALTKRAPHRMPRAGKMTNYIIFFP